VKIRGMETNTVPSLWGVTRDVSEKYSAPFGDYLKEFIADPQMRDIFDNIMCYHDYSSFEGPNVENHHRRAGEELAKYPGTKLWMSEICVLHPRRDLGMDMALDVAKLIHADLVLSSASAWHWWLAVSNGDYKDGLLYTDWRRQGDQESIIESKSFWALGNYSKFIRPGAVRVELKGTEHSFGGVLGSAYADPKTGKLVAVYINVGDQPETVKWTFKGIDTNGRHFRVPAAFVPYVTSATQDLAKGSPVKADATAELPPRSIVTFVGE